MSKKFAAMFGIQNIIAPNAKEAIAVKRINMERFIFWFG